MKQDTVFISYAREDEEVAVRLYDDLHIRGFHPWLDKKDLLPGSKWKIEIRKAIHTSSFFIAILSNHSVSKRGYAQRELKEALDIIKELPESDIFVIPARLDNCEPTYEALLDIQWVDLFPIYSDGLNMIIRSLNAKINIEYGDQKLFSKEQVRYFLLGYYISSVFGLSNPAGKYSVNDTENCKIFRIRISEIISSLNLGKMLLPEDLWSEGNKAFVDFMNEITVILRVRSSQSLAAFHLGSYGHIYSKNPELFTSPFEFLEIAARAGFDTTPLRKGSMSQLEYLRAMVSKCEKIL